MKTLIGIFFLVVVAYSPDSSASALSLARQTRVAVLDLGTTGTGERTTVEIQRLTTMNPELTVLGRDESGPAARGIGYAGSLNLTLEDARNLGVAIDCDFYIIGDAQTLRRTSSARPVFYESYASVFVVSGRTGRLIMWDRPSFEASSAEESEKLLLAALSRRVSGYVEALLTASTAERNERELAPRADTPLIEDTPDETSPLAKGLRLPQPYKRLRPTYPETAARAEAEATVDVLVDLDAEGEVMKVEVVRWAGFGLDEETVNTIRRMHFRPAMRDGVPLPMRVLLRYNFARPKKEKTDETSFEPGKSRDEFLRPWCSLV